MLNDEDLLEMLAILDEPHPEPKVVPLNILQGKEGVDPDGALRRGKAVRLEAKLVAKIESLIDSKSQEARQKSEELFEQLLAHGAFSERCLQLGNQLNWPGKSAHLACCQALNEHEHRFFRPDWLSLLPMERLARDDLRQLIDTLVDLAMLLRGIRFGKDTPTPPLPDQVLRLGAALVRAGESQAEVERRLSKFREWVEEARDSDLDALDFKTNWDRRLSQLEREDEIVIPADLRRAWAHRQNGSIAPMLDFIDPLAGGLQDLYGGPSVKMTGWSVALEFSTANPQQLVLTDAERSRLNDAGDLSLALDMGRPRDDDYPVILVTQLGDYLEFVSEIATTSAVWMQRNRLLTILD